MVQMGRVSPAPRPNPVRRTNVAQPRGMSGGSGLLGGLQAGLEGYQQGVQLMTWVKEIARERFGIDMRSPAEIKQAQRIQQIMNNPNPSLPELIELRSISPEGFEIYSDGVNRQLKTQEGRIKLQQEMGKLSEQDRQKEMDAQIFQLSGKLFKPDGSMDMDVAQMLRVLSPKDLQEQIKVGRYMQKMSKPRRQIASTVNDMMAGVLNRLRHTPEEGRAAAWRQAKRQLAMQMKSMKGEGRDNPVNGVLEWAIKDLDNMFKDPETGLSNFTNEGLENIMMGMAQFQDQIAMYARGKDVKQADQIATGNMSIAQMRQYVEAANLRGANAPIIDTMRARIALHDAQNGGAPQRQQQQQGPNPQQRARQQVMQARGLALDPFGGGQQAQAAPQQQRAPAPQQQAPAPQQRQAAAPTAPPPRQAPAAGGQQASPAPAFLTLEAAEQGGLPYEMTDAPRNAAEREPGKVYKLPNGQLGLWDGQQWAVADRDGAAAPQAAEAAGGDMETAQKAKAARTSLSVPRNGYSGQRLRRAVERAVQQYGGNPTSWRRVLSGKASQTLRDISQQGGALDLGSFG